jgi:chromosome segregation ATPase
LQDIRSDLTQIQTDINENNVLSKHVRKLRKYVNKKCDKVREDVSYGSYNADNEIFAYVDKLRGEFNTRLQKLESENTELREELGKLHNTYDSDYDLFVQRENSLMSKLEAAIHTTECLDDRVKDYEAIMMRQLGDVHARMEQRFHTTAGDLREEFAHAISREVEFESKTSAQLVQSVNDELTELITRSNQYHSHRYFGTVEDVKQLRDTCQTLKQSIGMVDAELSDTKETVEFLKDEVGQASNDIYDVKEEMVELTEGMADLKDDVYHELDRDYYDLKNHVKRRMIRHNKQHHTSITPAIDPTTTTTPTPTTNEATEETNAIHMIVSENDEETHIAQVVPAQAREENVIILNADEFIISDDEDDFVSHT